MIGPEGAGKTVFLAMLSRYIETKATDLVLKPSDFASSDYIATAIADLDRGDWPRRNYQGDMQLLKWQFGKGTNLHDLEMLDSAGEDLRDILKGDDDSQALKQSLDSADVLIFMLDLEGFLGTRDFRVQNENAWLLNAFLSNQTWSRKKRIVVASKADLFKPMLDEADGNVKIAIQRVLADMPNVKQTTAANDEVPYLAISSIKTTTKIGVDGTPLRIPMSPIECGDFGPVVEQLRDILMSKWLEGLLLRSTPLLKYVLLPILLLAIGNWGWNELRQTFRITFRTSNIDYRAGTNAQIFLNLIGDKGESGWIHFDGREPSETNHNSFETGAVDVFIRTAWRTGTVSEVVVEHDDSGTDGGGRPNGGWHFKEVEVEELREGSWGPKTTFPCNVWLDQDSGYGLQRRLKPR